MAITLLIPLLLTWKLIQVSKSSSATETGQSKWGGDLQIIITEVIDYSHIHEMTLKSLWDQSSPRWMLEAKAVFSSGWYTVLLWPSTMLWQSDTGLFHVMMLRMLHTCWEVWSIMRIRQNMWCRGLPQRMIFDIPLPDLNDRFATLTPTSSSMDDRHQILSISQVFCQETTAGLWMLPKHILWYMTICHLHRGCHLKTILNHMGHCYVWIWNCTKDCTGG